jgi:cytochrome P450 family 4
MKEDLDEKDEKEIGKKKRMDLMEMMVEKEKKGVVINDDEIKEEVEKIMFEGNDKNEDGRRLFICMMGINKN